MWAVSALYEISVGVGGCVSAARKLELSVSCFSGSVNQCCKSSAWELHGICVKALMKSTNESELKMVSPMPWCQGETGIWVALIVIYWLPVCTWFTRLTMFKVDWPFQFCPCQRNSHCPWCLVDALWFLLMLRPWGSFAFVVVEVLFIFVAVEAQILYKNQPVVIWKLRRA